MRTVETPELPRLLHRLERAWHEQGMPIAQNLRPGLAPEVIKQRLKAKGMTPSDEVLNWWAWHDGTPSQGVEALGHPVGRWLSLDQAVEEYDRHVRAGYSTPDTGLHGWFPLLHLTDGSVLVADCRDGGPTSTVTWISRELTLMKGTTSVDLTTAVGWWVELFETGVWRWDPERQWIDDTGFDDDTFPERRATGLL